jgi:D-beta-D-heptose 7-phosphate kinase/D-beta-D-heptose 1-phosphate adenosyltransferase
MKIVCASGFFNPLHRGHVEYLEKAKSLGSYLVVIVNNDHQRELKGSKHFMDQEERSKIVAALRCVDEVIIARDIDGSVCKTIEMMSPVPHIFAKGGDRFSNEIPESEVCRRLGIHMVDGLGAKVQSSSWLLEEKK